MGSTFLLNPSAPLEQSAISVVNLNYSFKVGDAFILKKGKYRWERPRMHKKVHRFNWEIFPPHTQPLKACHAWLGVTGAASFIFATCQSSMLVSLYLNERHTSFRSLLRSRFFLTIFSNVSFRLCLQNRLPLRWIEWPVKTWAQELCNCTWSPSAWLYTALHLWIRPKPRANRTPLR